MADIKNTVITADMIAAAQKAEKEYGVPTSITLAQILQESGVKKLSGLASAPNYNLFGVKAFSSWTGDTVRLRNGSGDTEKYSTYRKYNSYDESIADHAKVLTNSRYTKYTANAANVEEYAKAIQKGGYAQDPNYANSLIAFINQYNLTAYDKGGSYTGTGGTVEVQNTSNSLKDKVANIAGEIILFIVLALIFIFAVVMFMNAFDMTLPQKGGAA